MANEEHLAILKQGVQVWNEWRRENSNIRADLSNIDLSELNRDKPKIIVPNFVPYGPMEEFEYLDLSGANLQNVNLSRTNLSNVNLTRANLRETDLIECDLQDTNLREADLSHTFLDSANLSLTYMYGAKLWYASLHEATLRGVYLKKTNFENALLEYTVFSDVDLSEAINLQLVRHQSPSTIGLDTLIKSKGKIPIEFLEGAGVPKHVIENMQYLVDIPTIQYYSCFISYSTKDEEFAQQLNDRMKREGLRVWFAPEEMKGGQKIHEQLYEAIRYHDKLILVLSEASMNSGWVQSEIRRARKHEREDKRRKLFPISLVPFGEIQKWELFEADEGVDLAREIREYYIPDFSQWKNYDKFNAEFEKLLKALRAEE